MEYSPEELRDLICKAAADKKAKDIIIIKVDHMTTLADYFIICSGKSSPQVKSIANNIDDELAALGVEPLRREGIPEGRWAALDYGTIIVHIFHEEARMVYSLDRLWGDGDNIDSYTYED